MNDPYIEEIIQSVEKAEKAVEDARPGLNQKQQETARHWVWIPRIFKRYPKNK